MPQFITPTPREVVCAVAHADGVGAKNAQTSYSVWNWNTGVPSIFADEKMVRAYQAKLSGALDKPAKKFRKVEKGNLAKLKDGATFQVSDRGRKMIDIDIDAMRQMIDSGVSLGSTAVYFGVNRSVIRQRLGLKSWSVKILRDNTNSNFCVPIMTKAQSDRTNSIGGRA